MLAALQAATHEPQPRQRVKNHWSCGFPEMLSGFWHHRQARGQRLKKTVERMPGPSWVEKRWMLTMVPSSLIGLSQ